MICVCFTTASLQQYSVETGYNRIKCIIKQIPLYQSAVRVNENKGMKAYLLYISQMTFNVAFFKKGCVIYSESKITPVVQTKHF